MRASTPRGNKFHVVFGGDRLCFDCVVYRKRLNRKAVFSMAALIIQVKCPSPGRDNLVVHT